MSMLDFQFRRFNNNVIITMVQPEGTIVYNRTNKVLVVHDGITTGGIPLVSEQRVNTLINDLAQTSFFNSPAFTGNPTSPTQPVGTNNDRLATTKFVNDFVLGQKGVAGGIAPLNASNKIPNIHFALVSDDIPSLPAAKITSGVFGTARLGTGTANSTTFLRGDGTWQTVNGTTNLSYDASTRVLSSSTGNNTTLPLVTISLAGLMSNSDKTKLDGIAAGAQVYSAGAGLTLSGTTFSVNLAESHIPSLPTAKITSGVFGTARLGTGTANSTTFLRGDGTWQVINFPEGAVYSAGTGLTLSGSTFSLADERFTLAYKNKLDGIATGATANTGTVTSIGISVPTGLTVSNSPVTTNGTIAINLQSGYGIPTTAKQSNWDAAHGWGNHASAGYLTSIAHTHGIANSNGNQQFTFGVNDNIRITGSGATSITFDAATKNINISSTNTTYAANNGITLTGTTFSLTGESYTSGEKTKLSNTPNFTISTTTPSSGTGSIGDVWFKY